MNTSLSLTANQATTHKLKDINFPLSKTLVHSAVSRSTYSPNNLIAIAEPMLLLCSRLLQGYPPNNKNDFHLAVSHELHVFSSQCKLRKIENSTIDIAKRILTGTINNILAEQKIEAQKVHPSPEPTIHQEPIYTIIEWLICQPTEHIDLIELIYLCFKFGYLAEKENFLEADQKIKRECIDNLYSTIRQCKGEISKRLYSDKQAVPFTPDQNIQSTSLFKKISSVLCTIAVTVTFVACYVIDQNASVINHQITSSINFLNSISKS